MRVRHRIPSIFNLSMVDVLCCALGCVILLWLLNLRNARDHELKAADKLSAAHRESEKARRDTEQARRESEKAYGQLVVMGQYLAQAEDDRSSLLRQLNQTQALVDDLNAKYLAAAGRGADLAEKLKSANLLHVEMMGKLKADLNKSLEEGRREGAVVAALRAQVTKLGEDLRLTKKDLTKVTDDREELQKRIGALEINTAAARKEARELRYAAENRFEGIELTGKRVIFLVDMSGSMGYVDEKTKAPEKWADVRKTVARLMVSLPELEKFQVIVFDNTASFPLGRRGLWLDFDKRTSPGEVLDALAKMKPDEGDTNMSDAMELAFGFRPNGLDTIYLLSDGLPNFGTGLPSGKKLSEDEKTKILSQYIRDKLKNDWNRTRPGRPRVRINAVGFFYDDSQVGAFLWAMARENDGSFVGMSKP